MQRRPTTAVACRAADFVQAMTDPNHPEHDEMKEWIGRDWDPAEFDIEHINSWLAEFKL